MRRRAGAADVRQSRQGQPGADIVVAADDARFVAVRRLMTRVEDQPLATQLELEAQALTRIAATADAREVLTAFAEKRTPVFRGE